MAGHRGLSEGLNKEHRIDSGNALSDSGVPPSSQVPDKKLLMSGLHQNRWDFSAAKAEYAEDELQLRQPEGFPIIPLPSTVARAFEEAEKAAAARNYAEMEFDIYEDGNDSTRKTTAEVSTEVAETGPDVIVDEEEKEINNDDENEQVGNENEHAAPNTANATQDGQTPDNSVDALGRTRAATNRRKALEAIQVGDSSRSMEEEGSSKKRKRGRTQKPTQPRKQSTRKSR